MDIKYLLLFWFITSSAVITGQNDFSQYVDPFIGTGGHGHTFPGPTTPFGMMQLSPDTRLTGWDGCSGYHYTDTLVYGFSHTHLSGTGVSDYGDLLLMPFTGNTNYSNGEDGSEGYGSSFNKEDEIAQIGYYKTYLSDYQIKAELSTTPRAGFHQYTYKSTEGKKLLIDLCHRDEVIDSYLKKVSKTELEGYRHSNAWATDQRFYFVIQFDQNISDLEFLVSEEIKENIEEAQGTSIKAAIGFTSKNAVLKVRVGVSSVDIEGARKNLEEEIDHWEFDVIKNANVKLWEKELSKIEVKDSNEDKKTVFYTALYHTMIAPNLFTDIDGRYLGTDFKIHQAEEHDQYTVFSLWDTYRATHPLYTIIQQKKTNDFINTFINQYEQGGSLPMWELSANYTGCMIGYHAAPVISDAFVKGIRGYDTLKALKAMVSNANADELGKKEYFENGLLSIETEHECVSKTLEYAYDDWTIAVMADSLNQKAIAEQFYQRSQYYKNVFDPKTKFMRARSNNRWYYPFDPAEVNFNYTEANAYQYSYYVPHDITGWSKLIGGDEKLLKHLDALFSAESKTSGRDQVDITGLIGQYAHGNEPSHHISYLYNYVGKPYRTQKLVRNIMDNLYSTKPNGLSGNEDCGQMSAWLVLSAMGFYPVTPGSKDYVLGSPWFEEVVINLENEKKCTIQTENNSEKNVFIQSITKNGENYENSYITHDQIIQGDHFIFSMGKLANQKFGVNDEHRPSSIINAKEVVAIPALSTGDRAFNDKTVITLTSATKDAHIGYSIDGGQFKKYKIPFSIEGNTNLSVYAYKENATDSPIAKSEFFKIEENRKISIENKYAPHYSAGGDQALIDFMRGGNDYRVGTWQGYEQVDLVATVELEKYTELTEVGIGFLQDENSWIFMPEEVEFFFSKNGTDYESVGKIINDISPKDKGSILKDFKVNTTGSAIYVKVVAKNRGTCPDYHKGAGGKSWIFADEIIIK